MTFLNPLVLLGLVAGAIPIILHLLNLRKLKTVEFSTLRFLKELQKTKIRRFKLKQIILLILRTLIILLAVLAFSRPTIEGTIPGFENFANSSMVILIDNSFSMDVSDEWGNRLNQAKNAANQLITGMKEGDEAIIIPMAIYESALNRKLSRNIGLLKDDLAKVKIENTSAELDKSLRYAAMLLDEAKNLNKEIFIISDLQKNILNSEINDSLKLFTNRTSLYIIPIGNNNKADLQNISIDSVNIITGIFQSGKSVEADIYLKNNSSKEAKDFVAGMLFNNKRVAQRTLSIPSSKSKVVPIAASPSSIGVYKCTIELENDALEQDNKRYFGFYIPEKPKLALIAEGEQLNFLKAALGGNGSNYAEFEQYELNEASGLDFTKYDMLILAGSLIRKGDIERIRQYVLNGGNLLLFPDDATDNNQNIEFYNQIGFGNNSYKQFAQNRPAGFTTVDKMHSVFEGVFKGTTDNKAVVESPKIFKALPANAGQIIIEMPGGGFLSESRIGEGRSLYCGVAPKASWGTLPFSGIFPTLIYRSVIYLTSSEDISTNVNVGNSLNLNLPRKVALGGSFKVIDPNGTEFFKQAVLLPGGAVLQFDVLKFPGVYTIYTPANKVIALISANFPKEESILTKINDKDLSAYFEFRTGENTLVRYLDNSVNVSQELARARLGTELWKFFLIAALLCALAEMLVARNTRQEVAAG